MSHILNSAHTSLAYFRGRNNGVNLQQFGNIVEKIVEKVAEKQNRFLVEQIGLIVEQMGPTVENALRKVLTEREAKRRVSFSGGS